MVCWLCDGRTSHWTGPLPWIRLYPALCNIIVTLILLLYCTFGSLSLDWDDILDRDHLNRILQICGTPDPELMAKIESAPVSGTSLSLPPFLLLSLPPSFSLSLSLSDTIPLPLSLLTHTLSLSSLSSFSQARQYVETQPKYEKKDFTQFFVGASPTAVDVLTLLLNMDPDKRPTAEQALEHKYFQKYHMPKDEVCNGYNDIVHVCVHWYSKLSSFEKSDVHDFE